MCKYCESTLEKTEYIIQQNKYELYIDKDIRCMVMDCVYDCDFEVTIKYCPFCGKKLGG